MAGKKGRSGRPRGSCGPYKHINVEKLRALALVGTPIAKMATLLGVSHDLLEKRYLDEIHKCRAQGEDQLLGKAFQSALSGNTRILELCLINRCQWTNRPEVMVQVTQNTLALDTRSPEAVKAHLVELQRAVMEEANRFTQTQAADDLPVTNASPSERFPIS